MSCLLYTSGFAYQEAEVPVNERPEIDRWILSVLNSLVKNVDACYNDYEPTKEMCIRDRVHVGFLCDACCHGD